MKFVKAHKRSMFLVLFAVALVLIAAVPAWADVTAVNIDSPTQANPASVRSGVTVPVQFDVTTDDAGLGEIYIRIGPAANPIGTLGPFSYNFANVVNYDLQYQVTISSTAAEGLYEVFVQARQPAGSGTWASDVEAGAVRVDNTPPAAPALASPEQGGLTNDGTPTLDWQDVTDPSAPVRYQVQVNDDQNFAGTNEYESDWITGSQVDVPNANALSDGTYYWRVRARDAAGNVGPWSEVRQFRVDATAPAAPTLTSPANGATLENNPTPTLDWSDVTDPSTPVWYQVQVNDDQTFTNANEYDSDWINASEVTTSALANGTYYWRVRARDAAGNVSDWSAVRSFTITDTIPPAAPGLVSPAHGVLTNNNTPTLDWADLTDPGVQYQVQVDNNADFSSPEYAPAWSITSQATTSALLDGTYYWRVRARDAAGNVGPWSEVRQFRVDATAPAAPTLTSPTHGATLQNNPTPTLDWQDVNDPSTPVQYRVQVNDDQTFNNPNEYDSNWINASQATTTALPAGTYYWRVRARDAAGNESGWSAVRQFTITDTIAPAVPELASPGPGGFTNDTTPRLEWREVTDPSAPVRYQVQVNDDQNFAGTNEYESDWITGSQVDVPNANALSDGTYYWRVRARDAAENTSNWSAARQFTVDLTAPAAPNLLSPGNGATVAVTAPTLEWSAVTDPAGVTYTVQVDTDDQFTAPILVNVANVTTTTFAPTLADGTYYWRVQAVDGAGNNGPWSEVRYFRVSADVLAPSVTVNSPNGGETFAPGSTCTITWSASDNVTPPGTLQVDLYYSTDGGATWTAIATNEANDGAYAWTVPNVSSSNCLVKVEARDAVGNVGYDLSDRTFSITAPAAPPAEVTTVALRNGWNLVSLPLIPNDPAIENVLAGVSDRVQVVWSFDAGTGKWLSYAPNAPSDLTQMRDGRGYWVKVNADCSFDVDGVVLPMPPQVPPSYELVLGWNLIGFKSTVPKKASEYLAAMAGKYTVIYGYDPATQRFHQVLASDDLQPGKGYWIAVTAPGCIYP